jgi:hypothetical protein
VQHPAALQYLVAGCGPDLNSRLGGPEMPQLWMRALLVGITNSWSQEQPFSVSWGITRSRSPGKVPSKMQI